MKASIIITTYNRAILLKERAIPSALSQDYGDFEVLVIDDASADDTERVVRTFSKEQETGKLRYFRLPENNGLAFCRNFGVRNSKSSFVVFLDDDDAMEKDFLKILVPILENYPREVGAVVSSRLVIPEGSPKEKGTLITPTWEDGFYASIDDGWLLRREIFERVKNDETLFMDEDADFGIQFFKFFKAKSVAKPLLLKFIQKSSYSVPSRRRIESARKFFEKNLPEFMERGNRKDIAFLYRFCGKYLCAGGQTKEGIRFLWKSFKIKPDVRLLIYIFVSLFGGRIFWRFSKFEMNSINFLKARLCILF